MSTTSTKHFLAMTGASLIIFLAIRYGNEIRYGNDRNAGSRDDNRERKETRPLQKAWDDVFYLYQRRAGVLNEVIRLLEDSPDFDQQLISELVRSRECALETGTTAYRKIDSLTPERVEEFASMQASVTMATRHFLQALVAYPDRLKAFPVLYEYQPSLEDLEDKIAERRRRYDIAVSAYLASN